MTRQLALEGSEHGILVNSISPGLIESNATQGQLEDDQGARDMRARTLLGRFGRETLLGWLGPVHDREHRRVDGRAAASC